MLGGVFDIIDGLRVRAHFHANPWTEWFPFELHHDSRVGLPRKYETRQRCPAATSAPTLTHRYGSRNGNVLYTSPQTGQETVITLSEQDRVVASRTNE